MLFSPEVLRFGYIWLSLFWPCFLFSFHFCSLLHQSTTVFFSRVSPFFFFFFKSFNFHLFVLVLSHRTNSTCRCQPVCHHQPWAACCWRFCRGKKGTGEAMQKAAGEEQLWSALGGRKGVTGCCHTCRPTAVLPGIYGTSLTWPTSQRVGIE